MHAVPHWEKLKADSLEGDGIHHRIGEKASELDICEASCRPPSDLEPAESFRRVVRDVL